MAPAAHSAAHPAATHSPPRDGRAVGWHRIPGRSGEVRWWNGADWAGRVHPYPALPRLVAVRPLVLVVPLAVGIGFMFAMLGASGANADLLFVGWMLAWDVMVAEFVRGIGASSVRAHTPAMVGEAAWIPDPAATHALRYWDGHRFTEHVADPAPEPTDSEATDRSNPMVLATDAHTGPQWDPPAPAWERLGRASGWSGVLAFGSLANPLGFAFVVLPCAVVALWWAKVCIRNASRLRRPVPVGATVGIVSAVLALLLLVPAYGMWNAIGNANW